MTTAVTDVRLDEIRRAVQRAHEEIGAIASEGASRRFRMSIPADPARDSDLLITSALDGAEDLLSEVDRLKAELASTVELGGQFIRAEARAVRELEAEVAALRAQADERAALHGSCADEALQVSPEQAEGLNDLFERLGPPPAFTDALGTAHMAEEGH